MAAAEDSVTVSTKDEDELRLTMEGFVVTKRRSIDTPFIFKLFFFFQKGEKKNARTEKALIRRQLGFFFIRPTDDILLRDGSDPPNSFSKSF